MKMSKSTGIDSTNVPLLITSNDMGGRPIKITPSSSLESCFKAKSCRSFARASNKQLSTEHRNKSVPHNLQVFNVYCL